MRWRCHACAAGNLYLEWEGDPQCPRCGRAYLPGQPMVVALTDVHLVVMDPQGPIWGGQGRQRIACQPKRDVLARHNLDLFSATDDPRVVTCPSCKGTPDYEALSALYPEIALAEAIRRNAGMVVTKRHT